MDEKWNVFTSFPKWRNLNREHIQSVKKVLAKLVIADHLRQISMRGGDQTNIDVDGFRAAQPFELPFLQGAQELGLQIEADISDLVQK